MHPEVQELQSKLKEILYDCAVEIRATKAALYLVGEHNRFELVTEYGFRGAIRPSADRTDPVIDRCGRGRTPFFINGLNADARFSLVMFEAATDRLMAAPIYLRGHLVGVIDMRDKQNKMLFDAADLPKAQKIADRIGEQFRKKNVFGQHFITLSEAPESPVVLGTNMPITDHGAAVATLPRTQPPARMTPSLWPAEKPPATHVPRLSSLILEARSNAEQIAVPEGALALEESDIPAIHEMLRALLLLPGAVVAVLSAYAQLGGIQEIAARSTLTEGALNILQNKLNLWLTKRGERQGSLRTNVVLPFGNVEPPIREQLINKVFTAPVAGPLRGIYLTVVFTAAPERMAHELLGVFHRQLQTTIEQAVSRRALQKTRMRIATALLEPDFSKYPELRRHSEAVAARVETFANFVRLVPAEAEAARIVAIIHDVGMRLLDYDRLYRKPDISPDEMAILREHPAVGATIVEPLLGREIARAVLCHHERWDGLGYPNNLTGTAIPAAARIVQICDVYETMIANDAYAASETLDNAAAKMAEGAGTQFDPELTQRFLDMLNARLT